MTFTGLNKLFPLAVLLLLASVLASPFSGKSALGLSPSEFDISLAKTSSKQLNVLENFLPLERAVLGCCVGADKTPDVDVPSNQQLGKYDNRTDITQRNASDVNVEFTDNNWKPPYQPGTQVTEYTTKGADKFVRVHGDGSGVGGWVMRKEAIEGLTPIQIQQKYSLLNKPTHISDVNVPANTRIRTGKVESNFEIRGGGGQGATQYELLDDLNDSAFTNTRPIGQ